MKRKIIAGLLFCMAALDGAATAAPINLIANGGFESGDFSGWSVNSSNADDGGCNTGWSVGTNGNYAVTGCANVADPIGTYAAYQSFDGTGPKTRTLSQSFVVPKVDSATLFFSDSYYFSVSLKNQIPRTFDVNLNSASGSINIYHFVSITGNNFEEQNFWAERSFVLSSILQGLAGQTVELAFVSTIPETYSGPAGFGLDNIRLEAALASSDVPEPSVVALFGLALAGLGLSRRR